MKTSENNALSKITQKDYSLSFKLQVVQEIELGELTKSQAKLKYGIQGELDSIANASTNAQTKHIKKKTIQIKKS